MPKPRRAKSKTARSARKDSDQLELTDQSRLDVSARTAAEAELEDEAHDECESQGPRRKWSTRLWNALAGLSLVPFAWVFTAALFNTFSKTYVRSIRVPFWKSQEFRLFGLGAGIWLVWVCVSFLIWKRPRPVRAYVFGHEVMHGLMARVFGGKVKKLYVSAEGGYIVTNKYNFLIALAPYLWPFYSVPVLAAWGVSYFWKGAPFMREFFLAALGLTWMFHLTFTLWVLPRGQSDLLGPGRIFSITLIYLANAILLGGALFIFAPEVSLHAYAGELWSSALGFYEGVGDAFAWCVNAVGRLWRNGAGA